ncbi:unnamed protein product [Cylindrotheca closterium]|uniref:SLC26A/SulP transporter domain-containing protein n=1 Tax=Cylindrotheca closterium TaxID=2856 RepID=A0AAD2FX61_9STRA|nr:unnamed protein product [Cylindrotheca closterium]
MGKPKVNPFRDLISGAILAASSIPQLVGYSETAGYSGYHGLASAGLPLLAWGMVTGSPFMNAGVTSITALMAKSDLNGESFVNEHGEDKYIELVAAYSFWVGIASVVLAVVGFGRLAQGVPKPVKSGFKYGCSVGVLVSALPNGLFSRGGKQLMGLLASSSSWSFVVKELKARAPAATGAVNVTGFIFSLTHPLEWSLTPTLLFLIGTWFVMDGKKFLPDSLPPGTEVILVTVTATVYSIVFDYEGGVVGEIPELDPDTGLKILGLTLPVKLLDYQKVLDAPLAEQFGGYPFLFVSATLFAAVNFLSIMGIASGFESENGIEWSAPQELMSQGVACVVAAFVGSAPVSGSMSRSLVSRMTGTTSQLACMFTALIWIFMLPYMSVMTPTPKAALSAVIVSAVVKSVLVPKDLMKLQTLDFVSGWTTGIITAITSPTIGFGFGLVFHGLLKMAVPKKEKSD